MKRFTTFVLLLCSIQLCQAQMVVNAYDNDGKLIGQPGLERNASQLMVIRPDSIAVIVDFISGNVVSKSPDDDIVFAESDCQGQAYSTIKPQPFNWLSTYASDNEVLPLFLFMQNSKSTPISVQSWATTDASGCLNDAVFTIAFPVILIADPTQYGFIQTPTGGWGYAPPLKMKAVRVQPEGDAIFCNGYESCPTEQK
jgi:hypothetical protein